MPELVIVSGMSGAGRTEAMHVLEDLDYFCIDNLPPDLIDDLLAMPDFSKSTGDSRKLAIVCALQSDPALLILDEPLHGLDMRNRRLVKEIINEFCKRSDKTMIMVTHYKSEYPECITNEIFLRKNR